MKTATRYTNLIPVKLLADGAVSLTDAADKLEAAARELRELAAAGVKLDCEEVEDGFIHLVTTDRAAARRFDLHRED